MTRGPTFSLVVGSQISISVLWPDGGAAQLMERRRQLYAAYSPVFWRPRPGIAEFHAQFLHACSERAGAVAVRTEHGFILSAAQHGRCAVDDFAVDDAALWATPRQPGPPSLEH